MLSVFCVERPGKEDAPLGGGWNYVEVLVVWEV